MVRNADIGILHSLYNQAPKKVIVYKKQYVKENGLSIEALHAV
jgi:hypothetical protein